VPVAFTALVQTVYVLTIKPITSGFKNENILCSYQKAKYEENFKTLCSFSYTSSNRPHKKHATLKNRKKKKVLQTCFTDLQQGLGYSWI